MTFSTYMEAKILDHVFGGTTYTPSGYYWVALSTADPGEDGSTISEPDVNGSGYARCSGTNTKLSSDGWTNAAGSDPSAIHNYGALTFNEAVGGWGTITHFAIFDSSGTGAAPTIGGGNMWGYGSLTSSREITTGDTPRFASGDLDITLQ